MRLNCYVVVAWGREDSIDIVAVFSELEEALEDAQRREIEDPSREFEYYIQHIPGGSDEQN